MLDFQQTIISKLFDEKKGSAMVEYAILLAFIAVVAVGFATEFVMDEEKGNEDIKVEEDIDKLLDINTSSGKKKKLKRMPQVAPQKRRQEKRQRQKKKRKKRRSNSAFLF